MKKRIKKKEYKAVLRAKERLNGWNLDEDIMEVIAEGFFDPRTTKTREGRAIRRVINASGIDRMFRGWQVALPKTKDAMRMNGTYDITIFGKLYAGHSCFEDCPDSQIGINTKKLLHDPNFQDEIKDTPEYELVMDFIRGIVDAVGA